MLIRNRLTLRFTLLVVGILGVVSTFVYFFNARTRAQRFEHRLANSALLAGRLLVRTNLVKTTLFSSLRRGDLLTLHSEQISIYSPDNTLYFSSTDSINQAANRARLAQLKPGRVVSFPLEGRRETVGLMFSEPTSAAQYRIIVSAEDWGGWEQLRQLGLLLLVANTGALLLTVTAGWYFAGAALRPVARISRQAGRISATNLGLRLSEGNGRDELAHLAHVFNTMLAGLEHAFEGQKGFLSYASHELRTPLTALVGTLETALEYDTTLPEARQSMLQSLEAARRLSSLTNGLLSLAKVDGALPAFVPVRLDECLNQALTLVRRQYPNREWRLSFEILPAESEADLFMLPGNAELLTTALHNLLDNAGKYSAGPVRTAIAYADPLTLRLSITDEGPGLSAEELHHIYEPLYRSSGAQNRPGYGLGLPLTQRIIQRHGGRLEISSVLGQGTTATVWLPAVPL